MLCMSITHLAPVEDAVLMCNDGLVPTQWSLARVIEVHTGKDAVVRGSVKLRSSCGVYVCLVTKVVPTTEQ